MSFYICIGADIRPWSFDRQCFHLDPRGMEILVAKYTAPNNSCRIKLQSPTSTIVCSEETMITWPESLKDSSQPLEKASEEDFNFALYCQAGRAATIGIIVSEIARRLANVVSWTGSLP